MVHYGRHIIDPKTGLCEICDRGAIHEFRTGKRPGKKFLYSNHDGKFTYRPYNEDEDETRNYDEPTPRQVRKTYHPDPPPARTRPVVREEPVLVQRKVTRREHSPYDEFEQPHPTHPATFYYVDNAGQMHHQDEPPPEEPRRRYLAPPTHHSPPTTHPARVVRRRAQTPPPAHPTRTVRRRAQTPPPPASERWRPQPKRQPDSATEIIEQQYRGKQPDPYSYHSPKAEMYYLEGAHNNNHFPTVNTHVPQTQHEYTPSPRIVRQEPTRRQRHLEPIERKHYVEPEPQVSRKVYKKLPTQRYEPPEEQYIPNGHNTKPVRKVEKFYPTPRQYDSSPQQFIRSPIQNSHAHLYHLQSVDGY
jgi:hypothetical protein